LHLDPFSFVVLQMPRHFAVFGDSGQ